MEKETEQYLIKRIIALEDELAVYKKLELDPIYLGFKSEDLYNKAMAFDTLVCALGLKYDKVDNLLMINTDHLINKGDGFAIRDDVDYANIVRGLEYPL